MKKWLPFLLIVISLIGFFTYRRFTPRKVDYFLLEPRNFVESLVSAGRVQFSQDIEMAFQVSGVIKNILVKEGQKVQQGDSLITLDDTLEQSQVALAKADLTLMEINFQKLVENERQLAQEEYRRAEINRRTTFEQYQQAQILFGRGSISEEEFKSAQRNFENALSLENSARLRLTNIEENGPGFLEAKAQIERARLQLSQAETNLRKKWLFAPANGIVVSLKKNPGEFVQAGEVVLTLGENPFQVTTSLDEREYKKIELGMKALVSEQVNTTPKVIPASVAKVAPAIDPGQGTIEVTLTFDEKVDIKPNAAVNVEIIVREEKEILLFPKRYLSFQGNQPMVWTENDGRAKAISLTQVEYFGEWVKAEELPSGTPILNPRNLREGWRVVLGERKEN
ncbi:MAG: HlyD family efflux transporter periplasmic adaptor subunit [Atribacterota bacterium]